VLQETADEIDIPK